MIKKILFACLSAALLANLCLSYFLTREINTLKSQMPAPMDIIRYQASGAAVNGSDQLPLRVYIEYEYPDGTVQNMSTYDNMINTGNPTVDKAITNYLRSYRSSNLVCSCDAPKFIVRDRKDGLSISVFWREHMVPHIAIPNDAR